MTPFFRMNSLAGALSLLFLVGGLGVATAKTPTMTVKIFNNSTSNNIYPVLSAGAKSTTDTWLQAFFGLTTGELAANPYPRAGVYRLYINCCGSGENGIPPGGSVTLTLPLFSPLVAKINPLKSGQLIDWWQGGGINVYQNLKTAGAPPAQLSAHYTKDTKSNTPLTPTSDPPACQGCKLHIFLESVSLPNNDPQQLLEYTLGANPLNPKRAQSGQPNFLFDNNNVDYDVSYVNNAYLPAVMEPFGNALIGWVGAPTPISTFTTAITDFLKSTNLGLAWPLYVDSTGKTINKIPSALELFLNFTATDFKPLPPKSPPVMRMQALWQACAKEGAKRPICPRIVDVTKLLNANFNNYVTNFATKKSWGCTGSPQKPLTDQLLLAHLYGWGPFNFNCAADANLLQDTPGYGSKAPKSYADVKKEFDELQYWVDVTAGKYGQFDPYVALIHGPTFINAPFVYAYSVDDAVGNVQTDGKGLIIAVGGTKNLPNPDHFTPNVNINFGYQSKFPSGTINFTKYGRCTATPNTTTNPNFASFAVPVGVDGTKRSITNCLVSLVDNLGRHYQFKVNSPPPWPTDPNFNPPGHAVIDCTGNTNPQVQGWCNAIWAYQQVQDDARSTTAYFIILGAPPPNQ